MATEQATGQEMGQVMGQVMGLFTDEAATVQAIYALKESPWKFERVHTPIPSHKIMAALNLKKSKVGYYTLAGGILGFFTGFLLAIFCASQWDLIVSGKPVVALVPFVIVGFEFTILFAVFGNVIGLINQARLPHLEGLDRYDPRCSADHYGIVASCPPDQQEGLMSFFREKGATVRRFDV